MSKKQVVVLIVGLLFVALCAFFPPRMHMMRQYGNGYSIGNGVPDRVSVLSPYIYGYSGDYIRIDAARLLAECLVISALTGTLFLLMRLGHRQSSS